VSKQKGLRDVEKASRVAAMCDEKRRERTSDKRTAVEVVIMRALNSKCGA
jgi:hypothetical protein